MEALGGIFAVVYFVCVIGILIYILRLLARFVGAQERTAGALETIARKLRDDGKV